jgi:NADH:ubiquinone oxidoreductase subunit 6 (subunit J)
MKELYILISIFLFLTLSMHYQEWLSNPVEHIYNLSNADAYGFGLIHPLVFTFLIYILILLSRIIRSFFKRKKEI